MKLNIMLCFALLTLFVNSNALALERFFLTPTERLQLDALRDRQNEPKSAAPIDDVEQIQLNGMVLRKSGQHTIWINGSVQSSHNRSANYVVQFANARKDSVPIKVINNFPVRLRPGQIFDLVELTVKDVYQNETLAVKTHVDSVQEKQTENQEKNPLLQLKSNMEKIESANSFLE